MEPMHLYKIAKKEHVHTRNLLMASSLVDREACKYFCNVVPYKPITLKVRYNEPRKRLLPPPFLSSSE